MNNINKGKNMKNKVNARSYTLETDNGGWLAQVVITDDGMFSAISDYGNFGFAWRAYGHNFKEFLISIKNPYFADKMSTGMGYVARGKGIDKACEKFAEKILPPLQKILKEEIENGIAWTD